MSITDEMMIKVMKSLFDRKGSLYEDDEVFMNNVEKMLIEMLRLMKTDIEFLNNAKGGYSYDNNEMFMKAMLSEMVKLMKTDKEFFDKVRDIVIPVIIDEDRIS
uniref:Uncharacterized protein n=1 Tax=Pithovirus LCPAC401 TaxID=2506595 RepID=A0A481ZAL2_9VIRU|nr:MAG: hypothetical protein LCPAC401_04550 [Pithovirus LCPAC401]